MTRSSRLAPAVLAVTIVLLLAAGAGTVVVRAGDGPSRTDPATLAVVAELQAFVESARGLRFLEPVDVSVVPDAEFRRAFDGGEPVDESDLAVQEGVLRAFGLLDADDDLGRASLLGPASVAGFYDTETKKLVVRGTRATPFVRQVLVHELTHALDDQHFDLDREPADPEAAAAFEALVEGNAVVVENRFLASLSPAERAEADAEAEAEAEATFGDAPAPEIPDVLVELAEFPYRDGPDLVTALLDAGGQRRLDEAFRTPPTSSADVLHPERFLAGRHRPVAVSVASDGRTVDEGTLGELLLRFVLAESMPLDQAARAAAGWAGDRYVAWRIGRQTCVRTTVAMESTAEATELVTALRRWAGDHPGATVSAAASPAAVSLLRCA